MAPGSLAGPAPLQPASRKCRAFQHKPVLHAGPDNIFVRTADAVEHALEQQLTADKAARPAITAL